MDRWDDDGNYKCLCQVCKKDITDNKHRFEANCSYDLCKKHYHLVTELAERIIDGLEYLFNENKLTS